MDALPDYHAFGVRFEVMPAEVQSLLCGEQPVAHFNRCGDDGVLYLGLMLTASPVFLSWMPLHARRVTALFSAGLSQADWCLQSDARSNPSGKQPLVGLWTDCKMEGRRHTSPPHPLETLHGPL